MNSIFMCVIRYDRLYKYDITKQLKDMGLEINDNYFIRYHVQDLEGNDLGDDTFGNATIVHIHGKVSSLRNYFEGTDLGDDIFGNATIVHTHGKVISLQNYFEGKDIGDDTFGNATIVHSHGKL
jgi:hypothetical protein